MKIERRKTGREEPTVCYCEREEDLEPGACYGPVIRDIYIVECCTEGYGSVIINGRKFPVKPGDCYVLLPGDTIIHTADWKEPRRGVWCAIDGLSVGVYLTRAGITSENPFASATVFEEIRNWLEKMVKEWGEGDDGARLRQTACIYGLLGTLLRGKTASFLGEEWVEKALGLMEARYHQPLNVTQIAKEIGLERAYFSVLFKEKTGLPPHQYLTALRIGKACSLLERPDCNIAAAAESVGLDPRNFARLFKKEIGKTPLQYKKARTEQ